MDEERKNKGGRPATGRAFPHKVYGYLGDEEQRLLNLLAAKDARGDALVIRLAIRELARREGIE